jgi:nitroreductase
MDTIKAIKTRRSIRFFKQDPIPQHILLGLIDAGRCAPSAANCQPLEYVLVTLPKLRDEVFDCLAWAAYVKPKRNPPPNKRPVAYTILLVNGSRQLADYGRVDAAAAIENILLAAHSLQIGSCWLGSVNRDKLAGHISLPSDYTIDSVIALGYPDESPVMEDCKADSTKYYLDEKDCLHVPKRPLNSITHFNAFGNGS